MSLSLLLVLTLAGVWVLVIGQISLGQAVLGLLFGTLFVAVTGVGRGRAVPLSELPRRLLPLGFYLLVLVPYELARSNLDMTRRLLRPRPALRPGIVRFRLGRVSEATSAALTHAVTVGPGEMVVDTSEDGCTLYVHLIDASELEAKHLVFWRRYQRVLEKVFE